MYKMRKTFKYRIYPNRKQDCVLTTTLNSCRWLYNHFLEQRKTAWGERKECIGRYDQSRAIKYLKQDHSFLIDFYGQVLQNVSQRVDLAFRSFFRRSKKGEKPGYPRFKNHSRYDSFTYPQTGFSLQDNYIKLSKIGFVKIRKHRPFEGIIKTCTVKRSPTGKWFITLVCDIDHESDKQPVQPIIGIDVGLTNFAILSDTQTIQNPRFFRQEEQTLAKAQRKLSKQDKGSFKRRKSRRIVARIHERITNKRHNFAHQESRKIVNQFNTIVVEDLKINDMRKFRNLNKSINDAAWRMFLNHLEYKAEEAGKQVIKINPAYTSQTCSQCGNRQKLKLSQRTYNCPICNLSLDRDHNAAINVMTLGMQSLGVKPIEASR